MWIGEYSNVIERSHAAKVAQSILDKKDLGCVSANQLYTIVCDSSVPNGQHEKKFWILLGVTSSETPSIKGNTVYTLTRVSLLNIFDHIPYVCLGQAAGHPDEDELYESAIVSTNAVYEVVDDKLVILPEISETMAKIEILDPSKVRSNFSLSPLSLSLSFVNSLPFANDNLWCSLDIGFRLW